MVTFRHWRGRLQQRVLRLAACIYFLSLATRDLESGEQRTEHDLYIADRS
jgi:hypothetical protein